MAAGVSKKLWEFSDIAALVPEIAQKKHGNYKKKNKIKRIMCATEQIERVIIINNYVQGSGNRKFSRY